jgi:hypothetical protein
MTEGGGSTQSTHRRSIRLAITVVLTMTGTRTGTGNYLGF